MIFGASFLLFNVIVANAEVWLELEQRLLLA
jgi:hypothetical protein